MKNSLLYILWGGLFAVCAGLGFIPEPEGAVRVLLTVLAVFFFIPPVLLLWQAVKTGSQNTVHLVGSLSALSLGLTVAVLLVSILTAAGSEKLGNFLHGVLIVVSSPMVCSGHWALSLFLWACLLIASLKYRKK